MIFPLIMIVMSIHPRVTLKFSLFNHLIYPIIQSYKDEINVNQWCIISAINNNIDSFAKYLSLKSYCYLIC